MKVDVELLDLCKEFIEEHKIRCSEKIYDDDKISYASLEFIESICDLIGYYEEDEDLDEDWDESDEGC